MIEGVHVCRERKCPHYFKCVLWEAPKGMHVEHRGDILEFCELIFYDKDITWVNRSKCPHGICPYYLDSRSHNGTDILPEMRVSEWDPWQYSDFGLVVAPSHLRSPYKHMCNGDFIELLKWFKKDFDQHRRHLEFDALKGPLEDLEL